MALKPSCRCPDAKSDNHLAPGSFEDVADPTTGKTSRQWVLNTDAMRGYPYSFGWLVEHFGLIDWVWEMEFADNLSINGVMLLDSEGKPVTPEYGMEMSTPPQFKHIHDQALEALGLA